MLYLRLIFAFLYYLLRPTFRRHSPHLLIFILLLCLVGLFFVFFRELPLLQFSPPPLVNSPFEEVSRVQAEREFLQKKQTTVRQLLNTNPTSRDLWLYNGWIAVALDDKAEITKTTEILTLLDPNNPQVQSFLEQL